MAAFTVYQDSAFQWRWQLKADNGRIIADSGEGYATEYNAVRAARRCKEIAPAAPIKRPNGDTLNEGRNAAGGTDPF